MKALLLPTQPQHVCNIMNKLKVDEIRKSVPKGFKGDVYIYCTKGKALYRHWSDGVCKIVDREFVKSCNPANLLNGKVVAKFKFNDYNTFNIDGLDFYGMKDILLKNACLTENELKNYIGNGLGYAWHIDNLVVFDKPMELGRFRTLKLKEDCRKCGYYEDLGGGNKTCYYNRETPRVKKCYAELTRPPQSYQFVEVNEMVEVNHD